MPGVEIPGAKAREPLKAENAVIFVREGKVVAYILGGTNVFKSGEGEFIEIGQGSEPGTTDAKALFLKSPADSGASIGSSFESQEAGVGTSTAKELAEVFAFAGSEVRVVIDDSGRSSFLQRATLGDQTLVEGSTTVEWPGGSLQSNAKTITHNLGNKAAKVWAIESVFNVPAICYCGEKKDNTFQVLAHTVNGAVPVKGFTMAIDWFAIG